jgi:hypothetical protein|nr:MAG TPA: hypothetical protein [Caudoviricetes sp.]
MDEPYYRLIEKEVTFSTKTKYDYDDERKLKIGQYNDVINVFCISGNESTSVSFDKKYFLKILKHIENMLKED